MVFEDSYFPADDSSIYKDVEKKRPNELGENRQWVRPEAFAANCDLFSSNKNCDETYVSGALNDHWFVGAIGIIAAHRMSLLKELCTNTSIKWCQNGTVRAKFFKNGTWEQVEIDTRIPFAPKDEERFLGDSETAEEMPLFSHNADLSQNYVSMLLKAYAKLHGSYEALEDGNIADALVDLTGGSAETINIGSDLGEEMVKSGEVWRRICHYLSQGHILGCELVVDAGNVVSNGMGDEVQQQPLGQMEEDENGIIINAPYAIQATKQIGNVRFVKLRNIWAYGDWNGPWGNHSRKWDENPAVEREMTSDKSIYFNRDDPRGYFWMEYGDFAAKFNHMYACKVFDDDYNEVLIKDSWKGETACGAHSSVSQTVEEKQYEEDDVTLDERSAQRNTESDGDALWFNNPQFLINVERPAETHVSLLQAKEREGGANCAIDFFIIKRKKDNHQRIWDLDLGSVVSSATDKQNGFDNQLDRRACREVSNVVCFSPEFSYVLVPFTVKSGVEANYILRLFSEEQVAVEALEENHVETVEGVWTSSSAGGAPRTMSKSGKYRDNPKWTHNPQYVLQLESDEPTTVKLVCERTDSNGLKKSRREGAKNFIGLNVSKALTAPGVGEEKEGEAVVKRKLLVSENEWNVTSDFKDTELASILFQKVDPQWVDQGLLVVPSLLGSGLEGSYKLKVFSNNPVRLVELDETRQRTLTLWWTEQTAQGCKLSGKQFKKNPTLQLKLFSTKKSSSVKVTLSRPEDAWKANCSKDSVGSMIGFYITITDDSGKETGEPIYHEGKVWSESLFVPLNSVSTPRRFKLPPLEPDQCYSIVPCTFEAGKKGPFCLTVESDVGFDLVKASTSNKK